MGPLAITVNTPGRSCTVSRAAEGAPVIDVNRQVHYAAAKGGGFEGWPTGWNDDEPDGDVYMPFTSPTT